MALLQKIFFAGLLIFLNSAPVYAYHAEYDALLENYVKPSVNGDIRYFGVDYDSWAVDPRHEKAMKSLTTTNPEELTSAEDKLAFWINAYNLLVIDLVVTTGERKNIRNQSSRLKTPWNTHSWDIGGVSHTLDHIFHKIIRPMGDPRAHFALTNASKSSPDLRPRAYRAKGLDHQLDDQLLMTLTNDTKGLKFEEGNIVRVHRSFRRYEIDFANGDVKAWLARYYPDKINKDTTLGYFSFNESLNLMQ